MEHQAICAQMARSELLLDGVLTRQHLPLAVFTGLSVHWLHLVSLPMGMPRRWIG
jgi:hypothetical protein